MNRLGYIGGSDISAIVGVNPYRTPLDVYLEKTGEAPSFGGNEATRWGTALEEVIALRYAEETGRQVYKPREDEVAVHSQFGWYRGHFDRLALAPAPKLLLEIKTCGARSAHRWGEPGTDQMPEEYLAQVHWYLPLAPDCDHAEVPVLIGGNDFRIYRVDRDPEIEAALLECAKGFWKDYIEAKVPPPIDGSESAKEWLLRRFPRDEAPVVEANEEATKWAGALRQARKLLAQAEAAKAEAENHLKELIGPAAGMKGPDFKISWKATKGRPSVNWAAVAADARIPTSLIEQHTTRKSGRMFKPTFEGEEE